MCKLGISLVLLPSNAQVCLFHRVPTINAHIPPSMRAPTSLAARAVIRMAELCFLAEATDRPHLLLLRALELTTSALVSMLLSSQAVKYLSFPEHLPRIPVPVRRYEGSSFLLCNWDSCNAVGRCFRSDDTTLPREMRSSGCSISQKLAHVCAGLASARIHTKPIRGLRTFGREPDLDAKEKQRDHQSHYAAPRDFGAALGSSGLPLPATRRCGMKPPKPWKAGGDKLNASLKQRCLQGRHRTAASMSYLRYLSYEPVMFI